ncbi:MAG: Rieske 2Fe-2S domain-containing protein [Actinomycetota bacterium]|nr:Rieske 2Fe-2S domain-containing protein [Actinomycetota bacterium]
MTDARFPFPIPFGWFCVGQPGEFEAGTPRALYYLATHLVGWRDDAGALHVQDAFCPHLGAHLGHGGKVDDGCITCPFHGWKFDAEGANVAIPYSERLNRKARLRTYPVVEVNGLAFVWYHPDETVAPMWELPALPECDDDEEWVPVLSTSYEIGTTWQEMAENGVDSAHFRYVHNTATVPELDSYDTSTFPVAAMRSSQKFQTPRGIVEGRIDSTSYGPGMSAVHFSGFADLLNLAVTTPIDRDRCIIRFNFRVKSLGDAKMTQGVGQAFANEVHKQVLEDKVIWEHKAHLVRPALADTDGPVMKFRKWCTQFYAEGVDEGDERTVFTPPWWPDRADEAPAKATASARIEG